MLSTGHNQEASSQSRELERKLKQLEAIKTSLNSKISAGKKADLQFLLKRL